MKIAIAADLHLRGDRPLCRTDSDWIDTQRGDLRKMFAAAEGCDELWISGDVFHTPRVSTECLNMALSEFKSARDTYGYAIRILAGNHDLPEHNYDNLERCSLGVLLKMFPELRSHRAAVSDVEVSAHPFGHDDLEEADRSDVMVTHQLTFPDEASRPPAARGVGKTARELLDSVPHCRCIVTGDYHHGYVFKDVQGRMIITPGCMNVQVADMKGYEPRIYVLDTETMYVEEHFIGSTCGDNVSDEYLDEEHARAEAMERIAAVAKGFAAVKLDYRGNVELLMAKASDGCRAALGRIFDTINKDKE